MKKFIYIVSILFLCNCSSKNSEEIIETSPDSETIYFPPINSDDWETKSIIDLGWNINQLAPLLSFLEEKNSKSFIILHNGKIVIEEYFNNHDASSSWYWASAGKTLTTAVSGIAQNENLLNLNNKVSDYLGIGWTSLTSEKEDLITCKNLLTMTSGLDDSLGDDLSVSNLKYKADAGTRWAYHHVYVKIQNVIENVSNQTWDNYFAEKLKNKIGMTGIWRNTDDLNVYWSNTRSMARFGLLSLNNGKWDNTQVVSENFINEAVNTSQDLNNAYGYLWWLNGKPNYLLPQSQVTFSGSLIPSAPNDMFAALGKNDQKIYIIPSKNLVIIRMGESAEDSNFGLSNFDDALWVKINALID